MASLFICSLMSAADPISAGLKVDHVTVAGQTLKTMEAQFEAAGIKVEPGGAHTNHATEMAIASFADGSYIELIARQADYDAAMLARHPWGQFIEGDTGPCAWAVRPPDYAAEVARLKAAGLKVAETSGGRKRPDGAELQWRTADVGDEGHGTFLPFLIQDVTPREKRAFPHGKPANRDQSGVLFVIIGVNRLSDAFERFQRAYPDVGKPLKQVDGQFGAELGWIPDSPVVFAVPLRSSSWIATRIAQFGEGPVAFVLASKKELKRGWKLKSRWFGRDIDWFDPETFGGWWLGLE